MNILISNDDGIDSPGIHCLAEKLQDLGHVSVVAPHRERSTAGHSLTLHKPLRCIEVKPNYYAVTGTPADCIYMATRKILKHKPDIIVSGINRGANLGNDVYYSGTVAAAREGAYCGIKAMAISLVLGHDFEKKDLFFQTAADFAKVLVPQIISHKYPIHHVVNVNVPNLPISEIKGVKISKLGRRYYSDKITENLDPRGKPYYWVGGNYEGFENIPDSDCVHVDQGYISITPLKSDSTDYELMEEFKKWDLPFAKYVL
jgi:5'-nucleotidase